MGMISTSGWYRYVVRRGDSLSRIASAQCGDMSKWPEIAKANGLKSPYTIFAGQALFVPPRPAASSVFNGTGPRAPQKAASTTSQFIHGMTSDFGDHLAKEAAKEVLYPTFKINGGGLGGEVTIAKMVFHHPAYDAEVAVTCEGVLTQIGTISSGEVVFTRTGVDIEYKHPAKNAFEQVFRKAQLSFDYSGRKLGLQLGAEAELQAGGKTIATSEAKFTLPNKFEFTFKAELMPITTAKVRFDGKIGFTAELTLKDKPPKQSFEFERIKVPAPSNDLLLGLAIVCGAIVIGTIAGPEIALFLMVRGITFQRAAILAGATGLLFEQSQYTAKYGFR